MELRDAGDEPWGGYVIHYHTDPDDKDTAVWYYALRDATHGGEGWLTCSGPFATRGEAHQAAIAAAIEFERRRQALHGEG